MPNLPNQAAYSRTDAPATRARIALAPMEGVVDSLVRELLTELGGIDLCVTEFIRVTDTVLPRSVFLRYAPELAHGGRTASGVPVVVQLLGSRADMLARNAARAAALGAPGIDLNFGCPSRTVNRHRGGAIMLETPEDVYRIVHAVRHAVPSEVPVTAKMRLGYADTARALENAEAIAQAGADALTVHARTKVQGYKPPAHWDWIARIRRHIAIPVTANGEIWSCEDYRRCRETSGCTDVMIGRGLLASPDLAARLVAGAPATADAGWPLALATLAAYLHRLGDQGAAHGRLKQWLHIMRYVHPEAELLFARIKRLRDRESLHTALAPHELPARCAAG